MQRSEAAAEDAGVNVHDLLTSLGDQARHAGLRREVNRAKHQRKLPAPLEKPQALKVRGPQAGAGRNGVVLFMCFGGTF